MKHPRDPREIVTRLTPVMLAETPERATVEALRAVLDVTLLTLIAANPEMLDDGWTAMPVPDVNYISPSTTITSPQLPPRPGPLLAPLLSSLRG